VKNISRCPRCQVKENLRIRYEDADKLPACLPDILEEIKKSCPDVITKGRPFRAMWIGYEADHLKVMVDTHFNLKPTGQVSKRWRPGINLASTHFTSSTSMNEERLHVQLFCFASTCKEILGEPTKGHVRDPQGVQKARSPIRDDPVAAAARG